MAKRVFDAFAMANPACIVTRLRYMVKHWGGKR